MPRPSCRKQRKGCLHRIDASRITDAWDALRSSVPKLTLDELFEKKRWNRPWSSKASGRRNVNLWIYYCKNLDPGRPDAEVKQSTWTRLMRRKERRRGSSGIGKRARSRLLLPKLRRKKTAFTRGRYCRATEMDWLKELKRTNVDDRKTNHVYSVNQSVLGYLKYFEGNNTIF